jgi:hypothetical protein
MTDPDERVASTWLGTVFAVLAGTILYPRRTTVVRQKADDLATQPGPETGP